MKKFARFLALALAIVMIFSLAACGGSGGTTNTNSGGTDNTASQEEIKEFNMGGKAIKVAAWWKPFPTADDATEKRRLQYYQMEEAKQTYNFQIEEIIVDQKDIAVNFEASLMSGDVWADIIFMRAEQAMGWARKGNLLDLSDIFPEEYKDINKSMRDFFTLGGKTYAVTYYDMAMENCIAFNKNIFDRVGLAYPYELVNSNKWTWDKFVEYVQKATVRDATTGKVDVYGYYVIPTLTAAEATMYTCINRQLVETDTNGNYVSTLDDPEVINFCNKYREFCLMDGVYRPSAETTQWADAPVKFRSGRIAMYGWSMSGGPGALKDMEDDWGVVPRPVLTEGQEYKFMNNTINVMVMPAALASDMEWAEQVAYVYNQIYKSPYTAEEEEANRLATFESQLRDKESARLIMEFTYNVPVVLNNANMIGATDWNRIAQPANKIFQGEDTVTRVFASIGEAHRSIVTAANEKYK